MSPTPEAGRRRAEALHWFATQVGELRLLLTPTPLLNEPLPNVTAAELTGGVEDAFAAAVAAGYSAAMATAMLTQVLQPAEQVEPARLAIAVDALAQLRARVPGRAPTT